MIMDIKTIKYDPDITDLDDAHVFTILEAWNTNTLVLTSENYDFTYRYSSNTVTITNLD